MFDNPLGDFPDLDEMEAAWSLSISSPDRPKSRACPGKQDPNWKPRKKDEPIDRNSEAYKKAAEAASFGLPYFSKLQWLQAQFLDHGESDKRGHVRFSVKFEARDAPIEHCTRNGLIAMKRVRWANLSTPKNFLTNYRKKRLGKPPADDKGWVMAMARQLAALAKLYDDELVSMGAPPCLIGFISMKWEGTRTYPGQFCLVRWREANKGWLPNAVVTQFIPDGTGNWDFREVEMHVPPSINRWQAAAPEQVPVCRHVVQ